MFKREVKVGRVVLEYSGSDHIVERLNCTDRIEEEIVIQVHAEFWVNLVSSREILIESWAPISSFEILKLLLCCLLYAVCIGFFLYYLHCSFSDTRVPPGFFGWLRIWNVFLNDLLETCWRILCNWNISYASWTGSDELWVVKNSDFLKGSQKSEVCYSRVWFGNQSVSICSILTSINYNYLEFFSICRLHMM